MISLFFARRGGLKRRFNRAAEICSVVSGAFASPRKALRSFLARAAVWHPVYVLGARFYFSYRRVVFTLFDLALIGLSYAFALALRYDFAPEPSQVALLWRTMPSLLAAYLFSLYIGGYNQVFNTVATFTEIVDLAKPIAAASALHAAFVFALGGRESPRAVLVLQPLLAFLGVFGLRACARQARASLRSWRTRARQKRRVVIVGAGSMGEILLVQLLHHRETRFEIVGFIDDDPLKWGMRIHGVKVLGGREALAALLRRFPVDEIIVAIASRRGEAVKSVVHSLSQAKVKPAVKVALGLDQLLRPRSESIQTRLVRPADLLNRPVVRVDSEGIGRALGGKTVLISGAGGTIGGELCRQVLPFVPAKLLLLENHATALFYREAELRAAKIPGVEIVPVLGDVRDQDLLDRLFTSYRPQVVLHAAAHKHVHQLEFNVHEGIANNVLGTYRLAAAAHKHGAEAFLLVSTDKAVRPSCVMGATKRVAELIASTFARSSRTRFVAVRFGNVLGSSGSVLKIFQEQIAAGGPVTVTDPQVTRYFMTVEEAAMLILQAASMARSGEIYVLKMGEPVRILDMARNLILLSGLEPGRDIDIVFTGLKRGEKAHEELVEDPAGVEASEHPEIMRLGSENGQLPDLSRRMLELEVLMRAGDEAAVLERLQELVPTFHRLVPEETTR